MSLRHPVWEWDTERRVWHWVMIPSRFACGAELSERGSLGARSVVARIVMCPECRRIMEDMRARLKGDGHERTAGVYDQARGLKAADRD